MDKNKQIIIVAVVVGYCLLMIVLFFYFKNNKTLTSQKNPAKSSMENVVGELGNMFNDVSKKTPEVTPTPPPNGPTIGPTTIIKNIKDSSREGWSIQTNEKWKYSINLPDDLSISNVDPYATYIRKNIQTDLLFADNIIIYVSANDDTANKLDAEYRDIKIGESSEAEKSKLKITRIADTVTNSGIIFRTYERKISADYSPTTKNYFYVFENESVYMYINAFVEGEQKHISKNNLEEIITSFKFN